MTLLVDTDRLRRILTASLPSGARAAELFIESRLGLHVEMTMGAGAAEPVLRVERRWEAGAHLRRFFEGRHESFVLDAPAPETLEALALHPEALCVEWLSGSVPMGVPGIHAQPGYGGERLEARLTDASPSGRDGPWSGAQLAVASALLERWLASVAAAPAR
ncbi:MAG TPA: hypothetical protein VFP98_07400, partial [Candidatus Polarisedimenticolia bacterium]|nr:hypothetical protein [Candidatus Polarisedimenticolia bacterium]